MSWKSWRSASVHFIGDLFMLIESFSLFKWDIVKFNSFWFCPSHPQVFWCQVNIFFIFFIPSCKFMLIEKKYWRMSCFDFFRRKYNFLSCLLRLGLKDIFKWYVHLDIFSKSVFNWTVDSLISLITEKIPVFQQFSDWWGRSLMYMKKKQVS